MPFIEHSKQTYNGWEEASLNLLSFTLDLNTFNNSEDYLVVRLPLLRRGYKDWIYLFVQTSTPPLLQL